ncbi:MAG TPA: helix-turn-helix domain-containing protein [Candidatus Dormibacteraeota bacterium]|nr:helix-turn-helix domain-containing protein [Candidatus Dormibacteraeota bacterium]
MLFRSYKPGPPLSDLIENFWLYNSYASPHLRERIFPSGTFELVINLREDELRIYIGTQADRVSRLSGAIVSGPYAGSFGSDTAQEASVLGVHFKPGGAYPFLGLAANELADTHVNLQDIWGRAAGDIRERLSFEQSPRQRFRILEGALLARLLRPLERHPAVAQALAGLRIVTPRSLVRNLVLESGISKRRFIDVFNFEVGIKPKLFARIQRFQRVLRTVHRSPALEWGQVALEYGYYDQSHLIRDFLAFSGFSPADYLRRLHDLRSEGKHFKFNHLPLAR